MKDETVKTSREASILKKLNSGTLGTIKDVTLEGVNHHMADKAFTIISIAVVFYTMYIGIFGGPTVMIHRISHLAVILMASPLYYPSKIFKKDSTAEKIFNTTLAVAGIVASIYVLNNWQRFFRYNLTTVDIVILAVLVLLVLENTRRAIGLPIVIISIATIIYCLFGASMPGPLAHKGYSLVRTINMITVGTEGLFSSILGIASMEIVVFLIFSALLQGSGALDYFMRLAFSIAGKYTGGPAKVAVLSSGMMGTVSGSTVANVTATGSITIPLMKLMGFEPSFAGAVEAAASAGGSLTPPILGATAFLIAEFLNIDYGAVALAALIPALLFYTSLMSAVHIRSTKKGLVGLPKEELPSVGKSLKESVFLLLPIGVLIVLMALRFTAMYSAFWAIVTLLIIANIKKETRTNLNTIIKVCKLTLRTVLPVSTACATAGIVVATLSMTGLGQKVGSLITTLSGGHLIAGLLLTQLAALILGTGLVTPATYTLLAVLCAPALINMGAIPIAAHLFVFHFALMGTLTPPVCLAAFAAAGIAGSNPMKTGLTAFRLALPGFLVPYFFVLNPALIAQGSIVEIIISYVTAVIGVVFVAAGLEGYLKNNMKSIERILSVIGGILLVYPNIVASIGGFALTAISLFLQRSRNNEKIADSSKM